MAKQRTNRVNDLVNDGSPKMTMQIKEGSVPVRVRSGPGTNYSHVGGKYLGKGIFEVDTVRDGIGSKSGWGHVESIDGWVALDFVEILK